MPRHDGKSACSGEQACGIRSRKPTKQTYVHHSERSGKQKQKDDVTDVGGRIEPDGPTNGGREIGLLERDEDRGGPVDHQRISKVFPSTVIRSARISSFSTVEG